MAGDGVSIQTNLVQLGNLAKAQSRGQAATQGPSVAQELQKHDVTAVDRVRETEKAEQDAVDPEQEQERRRKQQADAKARGTDGDDEDDENSDLAAGLGGLIDIKA